ncbi:nucleotidyltransferase domain-containing protein [Sphingomonas bacterium]|uniref:nucleotidyltransferase domain-containing protein n=1 Tax=Sphingomonas bacterium TaxID=1895847 RepID=UPI0015767AFF|nr:nucleotidyltransferase domain-containing protein [Sphingomonas bacterium]
MGADGIDLSTRDRATLLAVLAPFAPAIERVAVFGSRVLGRARPASDIDLVVYGALSGHEAARLRSRFEDSNLAVRVDLLRHAELDEGASRRHVDGYARTLFTRDELLAAPPRVVRS